MTDNAFLGFDGNSAPNSYEDGTELEWHRWRYQFWNQLTAGIDVWDASMFADNHMGASNTSIKPYDTITIGSNMYSRFYLSGDLFTVLGF